MRRLILGTAGHIDHGKTALVRALTGVDTDRLAEEKRRGITIDLGFARLGLASGLQLGIVDVPGHEGFVRNMLAGATGIDLVLLVVAADEGVMPQTREHLAIVELLGVRAGVVALSKTDLVDAEWLELAMEDVRGQLAGTPFADSPVIPVSAETAHGLDELLAALDQAAAAVPDRGEEDLFRLPVDRVFTMRGTGTVVTGTVWSGRIGRDDSVRILPAEIAARIRTVQVHGADADAALPGQRAAIGLAGIDRAQLRRGDVLVADAAWRASHMLTVWLRLLPDTDWDVRHRQRIRFHLGTAEVMARVAMLETEVLGPGESGWVQLRLEAPVLARAGDRFVIRSYSPVTTIGGGTVAEPVPPKRKRLSDAETELLDRTLTGNAAAAVAARARLAAWRGQPVARLPVDTRHPRGAIEEALAEVGGKDIVRVGDLVFARPVADRALERLAAAAAAFHEAHPLRPGMDREELRRAIPAHAAPALAEWALSRLLEEGRIVAMGGLVARAGFAPRLTPEQRQVRDRIVETYRQAGLTPPTLAELPQDVRGRRDFAALLKLLEYEAELVPLSTDLYAARPVLEDAVATLHRELGGRPALTPADFKTVFPISRKFLIPLLEYLDRTGVTARRGDERTLRAR